MDNSPKTLGSPQGLWEQCRAAGLAVSDQLESAMVAERAAEYLTFLQEHPHFFSAADRGRILERHLYESLVSAAEVSRVLSVSRETRVLDAGSGPGLPGMLFAAHVFAPPTTLVDSSRRRLARLAEWLAPRPGFAHVHCRYDRLEELSTEVDLVVMRALIPFPFNVELASGLLRIGGNVAFLTGRNSVTERARQHLKAMGFVSRETLRPTEIQFLGERSIHILHKTRDPAEKYPRPWAAIKRDLDSWGK